MRCENRILQQLPNGRYKIECINYHKIRIVRNPKINCVCIVKESKPKGCGGCGGKVKITVVRGGAPTARPTRKVSPRTTAAQKYHG